MNEIDKKDLNNSLTCAEYAKDVFIYLRKREINMKIKKGFLLMQNGLCFKLREDTVEWLIRMQLHYSLKNETLYLAVNIFDSFLEIEKIEPFNNCAKPYNLLKLSP